MGWLAAAKLGTCSCAVDTSSRRSRRGYCSRKKQKEGGGLRVRLGVDKFQLFLFCLLLLPAACC